MKGKNMILLSVAVIAIGLFVLPQTMAMFVGQHYWYTVRTPEGQYEMCQKCHVNEVAEWRDSQKNGGAHSTYAAEYSGEGCFCHQINDTKLEAFKLYSNNSNISSYGFEHWNASGEIVGASTWNWRSVDTPHAATIVDCVDCHWNESQQINNPNSAHYEFWNQTATHKNASTESNCDNNTVCMACHTHTHLNITWIRLEGFTIVANHSNAQANAYGAWDISVDVNDTMHESRVIYNGTGNASYYIWDGQNWTWTDY